MNHEHENRFEAAFADVYAVVVKGVSEHRRRSREMDASTARHVFWTCCGEAAGRGWKARLDPRSSSTETRTVVISRRYHVEGFALIAGIDVDGGASVHLASLEIRFDPVDGAPRGGGYEWRFVRGPCIDPLRLSKDASGPIAPDPVAGQAEYVKELGNSIEKRTRVE